MGNLFFNTNLLEHLKLKIKFWLFILPFVMMFAFPGLLLLLPEELLDVAFGETALTIILPLLACFSIGAFLGWEANKLIARLYFNWSSNQVRCVFSLSEVPLQWFKANGFEDYRKNALSIQKENEKQLSRNQLLVASRAALLFYILLSCYVVIVAPFLKGMAISNWSFFLWPGPLYGILIGTVTILSNYWTAYRINAIKSYISTSSYFNEQLDEQSKTEKSSQVTGFGLFLIYSRLVGGVAVTLFSLSLSLLFFHLSFFDDAFKVPDRDSLIEVKGELSSTQKTEKTIQLYLSSDSKPYDYPKKFGAYDEVFDSLSSSEKARITMLVTPVTNWPESTPKDVMRKVYEINKNNYSVRTYEEVESSTFIQRLVTFVFGVFMLASTGLMGVGTWIQFKQDRE